MAEALGVAGSAVGIASLGIQLCQGLLDYYQDWKSYHDDISEACDKVSSLGRTFELLRKTLEEPCVEVDRTTRVQECLESCKRSVEGLGKTFNKVKVAEQPEGLRSKMRAVTKRAAYPFKASTLAKLSEKVDEMLKHLSLTVQILHLDLSASSTNALSDICSQLDDLDVNLQQFRSEAHDWQQKSKFREVVGWLQAPDQDTNHCAARREHESKTNTWLLSSDVYVSWKNEHRPLWIYGKAGCGKSILCSSIIEDLKAHSVGATGIALLFFYFTFSSIDKQGYDNMLSSLVHQLCNHEPTYQLLEQEYKQGIMVRPSRELLERVFLAACKAHKELIVVLDALDEVPQGPQCGERALLLGGLRALHSRASNLKLAITSQHLSDIDRSMKLMAAQELSLSSRGVDLDIQRYVRSEFARDTNLLSWPVAMQKKASDALEQKAQGM